MSPNARKDRLMREAEASTGSLRAIVFVVVAIVAAALAGGPDSGAPVVATAYSEASR